MNESTPPEVNLDEEALRWQLRLSTGGDGIRVPFFRWLLQTPEHVRAFLKHAIISQMLRNLDTWQPDIDALVARVKARNVTRLAGNESVYAVATIASPADYEELACQLRQAFVRCTKRSSTFLDDLVQQAFLQCLEKVRGHSDRSEEYLPVALRVLAEFKYSTRRESRGKKRLAILKSPDQIANVWNDDVVRYVEAEQVVWQSLKHLPSRQRAAIVLWKGAGFSCAETAAALGCSPDSVRRYMRQALTTCLSYWKGYEGIADELPVAPPVQSRSANRNTLRELLKRLIEMIPGCRNVRTEAQVGTETVDLYYEERTSFRYMRVACECKDHRRPLTRDVIAKEIFPRYFPLLQQNLVDAVRVVRFSDIGVAASTYLQECSFSFNTLRQIEAQIMDFRGYLHALSSGFAEDGLSSYYIRPVLDSGEDLENKVSEWVVGTSSRPLTILAGGGMGKSSFARRLAKVFADQARQDFNRRIPILIPLREISGEEVLEAWLGKLLAAQHRIPGYHFSLFSELNRRGRFVLILDGFDEMKPAMSRGGFQCTLSQLNRLIVGDSRVLLLGRPAALPSGEGAPCVLGGRYTEAQQTCEVHGAPECWSLTLPGLSTVQSLELIRRYVGFRCNLWNASGGTGRLPPDIDARIKSIQDDPKMTALLSRPIQARMIADLVIDPEIPWRSLGRYDLYGGFIWRMGEREPYRPARPIFRKATRIKFIRRVAWWVWCRSHSLEFRLCELPRAVYGSLGGNDSATMEGVKRDLLAGSILEKKTGDTYHFPHRSFLEYLVAECLCEDNFVDEPADISIHLTPEIIEFIKQSPCAKGVARWRERLSRNLSPVSAEFLMLLAWAANQLGIQTLRDAMDPKTPYDVVIDCYRLIERGASPSETVEFVRTGFFKAPDAMTRLMCIVGLLTLPRVANIEFSAAAGQTIVALVLAECLDEVRSASRSPSSNAQLLQSRRKFMRILLTLRLHSSPFEPKLRVAVTWSELAEAVLEAVPERWQLTGLPAPEDGTGEFPLADIVNLDERLSRERNVIERFFRRYSKVQEVLASGQSQAWALKA